MPASDVVLILGAVGVLAGQIGALVVLMRNSHKLVDVAEKVNGHTTSLDVRVAQLTSALTGAEVEVPLSAGERAADPDRRSPPLSQ